MPDGEDDRGPRQAENGADLIFEIPLIGEVEQPRVVAEHHEMRGADAHLGHIIDLQPAALVGGGLDAGLCVGEDVVQHTRGNPQGRLIAHGHDQLKQLFNALPRQG
ncbi:hypothetical protein SDC9_145750 [bioreactor metagenome]|uniref:Uncharacterized protein n=1 Tax=bioreactor metagenome TaxID=1076179 RepID=A0A645ED28_9ZZZZ